jgi:hypothetical protein
MLTKIDYLLKNPIRAGLASSIEEYRFSSGNGAYEVDAC